MLAWSRCVSGRLFEPLRNLESWRNNEHGKQLGRDPTKPAAAFVTVRKRVDLRLQSTPITRSLLSRTADASGDGSWLGVVPFSGEGRPLMGEVIGTELDGRLFPDLSTLTPENLVTPADNFFIRTRTSKRLDPSKAWTVQWAGLVEEPSVIAAEVLAKKKEGWSHGHPWDGVLRKYTQCAFRHDERRGRGRRVFTRDSQNGEAEDVCVRVLVSGFDR
jgi:hypothetical protein